MLNLIANDTNETSVTYHAALMNKDLTMHQVDKFKIPCQAFGELMDLIPHV